MTVLTIGSLGPLFIFYFWHQEEHHCHKYKREERLQGFNNYKTKHNCVIAKDRGRRRQAKANKRPNEQNTVCECLSGKQKNTTENIEKKLELCYMHLKQIRHR